MKLDPRSRRAFLQGAGGFSLAVPFLPSLAPSKAAAAPPQGPTRLVFVYHKFGICHRYWWPGAEPSKSKPGAEMFPAAEWPTSPSADGSYRTRALSDIPGDMSPILGKPFDVAIRKKMAVVRGLDPLGRPMGHNISFPTTADSGEDGQVPNQHADWEGLKFAYSIDYLLENSPTFYPVRPGIGTLRTLASNGRGYGGSSSFSLKGSVVQNLASMKDPNQIYGLVFPGGAGGQADPIAAARLARLKDVADAVNGDYKETIAGRRISSHDKIRLDNFMSLVSQIRSKLDAPVISCSANPALKTGLTGLDSYAKINSALIDMEVAALACGSTRIVMHGIDSYGPGFDQANGETWHGLTHGGATGAPEPALAQSRWHVGIFAELIKKLDAVADTDGNTLLDNTLVVYRSSDTTGGHFLMDTPVLVAGGKGKIKTDLYIDYRNMNDPLVGGAFDATTSPSKGEAFFGRPYNNFLITLLKVFGIPQADYTKYPGQDGIGRYAPYGYDVNGAGHHYDKYVSTSSARNSPLPGLFTG
jgi:hypothetical protein